MEDTSVTILYKTLRKSSSSDYMSQIKQGWMGRLLDLFSNEILNLCSLV